MAACRHRAPLQPFPMDWHSRRPKAACSVVVQGSGVEQPFAGVPHVPEKAAIEPHEYGAVLIVGRVGGRRGVHSREEV